MAEGLRVEHQLVAAVQCGEPGDIDGVTASRFMAFVRDALQGGDWAGGLT